MVNKDDIESLEATKTELTKFLSEAEQQRTKDLLIGEISKIEAEITALKQKAIKDAEKKAAPRTRFVTDIHEHAFDESDRYVKIFIPFNHTKISEENVILDVISDNSFVITVSGENKDYRFKVVNLLRAISIEKSYKKVKPDMISVYLKKVKEGEKWGYLTSTEKHLKDQKSSAFDKETTSADPMGGIMDMMKKLYDSGDSEMKRTIAKAWTEGQEKKQNGGPPMFQN